MMGNHESKPTKPKIHPISLAGNITLVAGASLGLFVMAKAYLFTEVPAGTCPLTLNRPWLYASLALLGISLILSFLEPKKDRQAEK